MHVCMDIFALLYIDSIKEKEFNQKRREMRLKLKNDMKRMKGEEMEKEKEKEKERFNKLFMHGDNEMSIRHDNHDSSNNNDDHDDNKLNNLNLNKSSDSYYDHNTSSNGSPITDTMTLNEKMENQKLEELAFSTELFKRFETMNNNDNNNDDYDKSSSYNYDNNNNKNNLDNDIDDELLIITKDDIPKKKPKRWYKKAYKSLRKISLF